MEQLRGTAKKLETVNSGTLLLKVATADAS